MQHSIHRRILSATTRQTTPPEQSALKGDRKRSKENLSGMTVERTKSCDGRVASEIESNQHAKFTDCRGITWSRLVPPQISTIEQFVTLAYRYTRIISRQYREGVKGYIGGALSQVFPIGGSSNIKVSLGRTETLFERAEALTTASQERFIQFQKAMLRQRTLFMPIALFHQGVSAAHTEEDIESILNAMRVALQATG